MVDVPNLSTQIGEKGLVFAARADFDEGVQKAEQRGDRFEEAEPAMVSGGPAINIDRFGGIARIEVLGFGFEMAVGFGQPFGLGGQGDRSPKDTIASNGGGDITFVTVEIGMFLIGQDILGQFIGQFEGGAHHTIGGTDIT